MTYVIDIVTSDKSSLRAQLDFCIDCEKAGIQLPVGCLNQTEQDKGNSVDDKMLAAAFPPATARLCLHAVRHSKAPECFQTLEYFYRHNSENFIFS